ncbi:BAG family molecular chaperone regulator 1-like isoform X1 [Haliotis rufescens]|uniref:BAG family molecular chaperone regulator 1-like isoform X1 n=1 Tax=Haliotis rufescens TaxID=6454 RepID=UPI00201EC369|nr:BAG family molecular chaperone regulator 1-like isoform X1 [Haliotis rufescens]
MAADGVDCLKLQLVHGPDRHDLYVPISGPRKHELGMCLPEEEAGDVLTVGHLTKAVTELTEIPQTCQRLIFKGRSLTKLDESLSSLGVKQGSKIMLLGKKPESVDMVDEQKLKTAEKELGRLSKTMSDISQELDGINKGFLEKKLQQPALQKLRKQILVASEAFMKLLESLDSLRFAEDNKGSKIKRKNMADRIQKLLERCDVLSEGVKEILQGSS